GGLRDGVLGAARGYPWSVGGQRSGVRGKLLLLPVRRPDAERGYGLYALSCPLIRFAQRDVHTVGGGHLGGEGGRAGSRGWRICWVDRWIVRGRLPGRDARRAARPAGAGGEA